MGIYDREYFRTDKEKMDREFEKTKQKINERMDKHEEEFMKTARIGMGIVAGTVVVTTAAAVGLGIYLIKKLCD